MKKLIILLFLAFSIGGFSQGCFPYGWFGTYEGQVEIFGVDSVARRVLMNLDIGPTENDSTFYWTITYGEGAKKDIRKYQMISMDNSVGHYVMDEKNGIKIESYLKNKVMTSFFAVSGSFIIVTYEKVDDGIAFSVISAKTEPVSKTGGEKFSDEEIPIVTTYPVTGRQRALLKKMQD